MQSSWVGVQMRKSYPDFVGQFDALVDADVRCTPYSAGDIHVRARSGLSSLCLRDAEYWMMRKPILYDIHVEEYHVNRVMRQFGLYQQTPVPIEHSVEAHIHRYGIYSCIRNIFLCYCNERWSTLSLYYRWTRQGQPPGSLWADKILPYVES